MSAIALLLQLTPLAVNPSPFMHQIILKNLFYTPNNVQVGYQVLILTPLYVAQKLGVVCGRESDVDSEHKQRWIILLESSNIVVSLTKDEFNVINPMLSVRHKAENKMPRRLIGRKSSARHLQAAMHRMKSLL